MAKKRYRVSRLADTKWYVVDEKTGKYLHFDNVFRCLTIARDMLFPSKEAAQEALKIYNKVIRIGGE